MRLSMRILYERMGQWKPVMEESEKSEEMMYVGVAALTEKARPLAGHIMVARSEEIDELEGFSGNALISLGMPSLKIREANLCMVLPDTCKLLEVLYAIHEIFARFALWDEELWRAVSMAEGVGELCKISSSVLENSIILYDHNLFVLATANETDTHIKWEYDRSSGHKILPTDIMNAFKMDDEFLGTMNTRGVQLFSDTVLGYRVLYYNFWIEDVYAGRLCVNELQRKFRRGDYKLVARLAQSISMALKKGNVLPKQMGNTLAFAFRELLDGNVFSKERIEEALRGYNWEPKDTYCCTCIPIEQRDKRTLSAVYTCNRLESNFPGSLVVQYNNMICMILNMRLYEQASKESWLKKLKEFLREGFFKAGISKEGTDFLRLQEYYVQACRALEIGSKKNSTFWYFHFEDYIMSYLLQYGSGAIGVDLLCHRGIIALMEYDRVHNTEMTNTLRVYLEQNMNLAKTSKILHIHRSTLLYRIDRIHTISEDTFDSARARFNSLLSFQLLDSEHY